MLTIFFVLWGVCAVAPLIDDDVTFIDWFAWTLAWGVIVALACTFTAVVL